MSHSIDLKTAKAKCAHLCSLREYAAKDIRIKLKKWNVSLEEQELVVAFLEKEGYLNELRFAKAYCHDKFHLNGWGRLKIKQCLNNFQLSEENIQEGLNSIAREQYLAKLKSLALSKWRSQSEPELMNRRQKVARFLAGRGFEMELVWAEVNLLHIES